MTIKKFQEKYKDIKLISNYEEYNYNIINGYKYFSHLTFSNDEFNLEIFKDDENKNCIKIDNDISFKKQFIDDCFDLYNNDNNFNLNIKYANYQIENLNSEYSKFGNQDYFKWNINFKHPQYWVEFEVIYTKKQLQKYGFDVNYLKIYLKEFLFKNTSDNFISINIINKIVDNIKRPLNWGIERIIKNE